MVDLCSENVRLVCARLVGKHNIFCTYEIRAIIGKERHNRRKRRVPVEKALPVEFQKHRVNRAVRSDDFVFRVAAGEHSLGARGLVVDSEKAVFVVKTAQKLGGDTAVFAAAHRNEVKPRALKSKRLFFGLFFGADNFHKGVFVCRNAVSIEKFRKPAEIKLFPPGNVLFAQIPAFYEHARRAGGFPIADKLHHAEAKHNRLCRGRVRRV